VLALKQDPLNLCHSLGHFEPSSMANATEILSKIKIERNSGICERRYLVIKFGVLYK
jgi:hypothetical protein